MPLISILRFLLSLFSVLLLAAGAYLVWQWFHPAILYDLNGVKQGIVREEDWKLWVGIALLVWSVLGGLPLKFLLAATDKSHKPAQAGRVTTISSPTGSVLHVEVFGPPSAPTIILTHGWGLDRTIWGYTVARLSRSYRVVVWDLPGLGKSKPQKSELTLAGLAVDLATVIKSIEKGPVLLVGHSIGGMTIQTLVRDHAHLFGSEVQGIVLLNTTYTNPLKTMIMPRLMQALRKPLIEPMMYLTIWLEPLAWLSAWQSYLSGSAHLATRLGFGRHVTRGQLEHTTLLTTRNRPGVQARGNLAMFNWDATGAMTAVAVPALIVAGDMDIITKEEASRVIAGETPTAQLKLVTGVNHMGFLEAHEAYDELVKQFADEVFKSRTSA